MPRYYVKNDKQLWNIFSTVADDYLLEEFVPFNQMKALIINNEMRERMKELDTLLTKKPKLNRMTVEEAESLRLLNKKESEEE